MDRIVLKLGKQKVQLGHFCTIVESKDVSIEKISLK